MNHLLCMTFCLLLSPMQAMPAGLQKVQFKKPAVKASETAGSPSKSPRNLRKWSFDSHPIGGLPPEASVFTGKWEIRAEPDAPSPRRTLCQVGDAESPFMTLGPAVYSDVVMTARFKIKSADPLGNPTAGLIFRLRDKNHYYLVRVNAGEGGGNLNIYRYWLGQRDLIKGARWPVSKGRWYTLKVDARGDHILGYLDDALVAEAYDKTYSEGKVGLWVKYDSNTCFDDVTVHEADPSTFPKI
jgi:hypothetical protein